MADQDYNHTAELIKAAIPYVDSNWKGPAELIAKLLDLLGSFKSIGNNGTLSASSFRDFKIDKIDIEGLLKGIRPICNNKEQEIVDRILSIFNMKQMFEMYNNMMSTMKTMQEFGGFNFNGSGSGTDSDNVTNNFTGSNFDSIFQSFSSVFSSSNTQGAPNNNENSSDYKQNTSEYNQTTSDFNRNSSEFNQTAWDFNQSSSENNQTASDLNNFTSFYNPFETSAPTNTEEAKAAETKENNASEFEGSQNTMNTTAKTENSQNPMNNKMFDMLKAMIPPEQMSTFENLSMLLGNMSYDNNKPDEKKE